MIKRNNSTKKSRNTYSASRLDNIVSVNPYEFIELTKNEKESIESVKFSPPQIGGKGFGKFIVKYKHPRFAVNNK